MLNGNNNMDKEPITVDGLKKIQNELDDLKNNQRPKVVAAIAEARAHGDLKENAEYHAAKDQQGHIESRVLEINDIIARANVVDVTKEENTGRVIFGSTVTVKDLEKNNNSFFKIVGKDEADVGKSLIYYKSPMGKALIGKKIKDLVIVKTPSGEKNFEILKVEYI
jgi:transcription elongation factor GreA|tara:strand:- start:799 stop:1296 length:498 start_codon:yes stop_codon:yes gene_type:complete